MVINFRDFHDNMRRVVLRETALECKSLYKGFVDSHDRDYALGYCRTFMESAMFGFDLWSHIKSLEHHCNLISDSMTILKNIKQPCRHKEDTKLAIGYPFSIYNRTVKAVNDADVFIMTIKKRVNRKELSPNFDVEPLYKLREETLLSLLRYETFLRRRSYIS